MRIRNSLSMALTAVSVVSASQLNAMAININGIELTKPDYISNSVWDNVVGLLKDLVGKEKIRVSIYLPKDPGLFSGVTPQYGVIDTCYYSVMLNFDGKKNKFPENYGENGNIAIVPEEGFFAFRFRLDFLQEELMKDKKNCRWLFEQYGSKNYVNLMDSRDGKFFFRTKITGPLFERKSDYISEKEATFNASNEAALKICRMVIRQAIMRKFFPQYCLKHEKLSDGMKENFNDYLDAIDYFIDNGKLFRYEMMGELGINWDSID